MKGIRKAILTTGMFVFVVSSKCEDSLEFLHEYGEYERSCIALLALPLSFDNVREGEPTFSVRFVIAEGASPKLFEFHFFGERADGFHAVCRRRTVDAEGIVRIFEHVAVQMDEFLEKVVTLPFGNFSHTPITDNPKLSRGAEGAIVGILVANPLSIKPIFLIRVFEDRFLVENSLRVVVSDLEKLRYWNR